MLQSVEFCIKACLHDATATTIYLLQLVDCEHFHLIVHNPVVVIRKIIVTIAPCEQTFSGLRFLVPQGCNATISENISEFLNDERLTHKFINRVLSNFLLFLSI